MNIDIFYDHVSLLNSAGGDLSAEGANRSPRNENMDHHDVNSKKSNGNNGKISSEIKGSISSSSSASASASGIAKVHSVSQATTGSTNALFLLFNDYFGVYFTSKVTRNDDKKY